VIYPVVPGGLETLQALLAEYRSKGSGYRQHKQRVFKASCTHHYRRGLIELLETLEFGSTNTAHAPVLEALALIKQYEAEHTPTLRDKLRCKEIWVVGAEKWRNPDEDLSADFEANRAENYAALSKPLDPRVFVEDLRAEMDAELTALNNALGGPDLPWLRIVEGLRDRADPAGGGAGATQPASTQDRDPRPGGWCCCWTCSPRPRCAPDA
jgi:hypothetical protein